MNSIKYFFVYLLPVSVYIAFNASGIMTFLPVFLFFGIVPVLELLLKPDTANLDKKIAQDEKNKILYDRILYLAVPVQVGFLIYFLFTIQNTPFGSIEFFGKVASMGIMCGVLGINVGHELGHRLGRGEQFLGEILLLTSLDTHFLPYHNAGHHKNVATPNDSATAKKNEWLFTFWITSHFGSYIEAWKLENRRVRKLSKSILSLHNRMVGYSIANIILLYSIYYFFGVQDLLDEILIFSISYSHYNDDPNASIN